VHVPIPIPIPVPVSVVVKRVHEQPAAALGQVPLVGRYKCCMSFRRHSGDGSIACAPHAHNARSARGLPKQSSKCLMQYIVSLFATLRVRAALDEPRSDKTYQHSVCCNNVSIVHCTSVPFLAPWAPAPRPHRCPESRTSPGAGMRGPGVV
jgi:hypothetical protein